MQMISAVIGDVIARAVEGRLQPVADRDRAIGPVAIGRDIGRTVVASPGAPIPPKFAPVAAQIAAVGSDVVPVLPDVGTIAVPVILLLSDGSARNKRRGHRSQDYQPLHLSFSFVVPAPISARRLRSRLVPCCRRGAMNRANFGRSVAKPD